MQRYNIIKLMPSKRQEKILRECMLCNRMITEKYHTQKYHNPSKRQEVKDLIRQNHKGGVKNHTKKIIKIIRDKNKGKKRSKETKINLSLSKQGEKNPNWNKIYTDEEKILQSKRIIQSYCDNPSLREKRREVSIKRVEKAYFDGMPLSPAIGKYEKLILDNIESKIKTPIIRQYKIAGYFIDGYCPTMNLAFEIDEPHHKYNIKKDEKRQKYIEEKLNCKFIRIKIGARNILEKSMCGSSISTHWCEIAPLELSKNITLSRGG